MQDKLRNDRRYLALLPGKEVKSWSGLFIRFSKVHESRAGITFDIIPSEICLKEHFVMERGGTVGFEQYNKNGNKIE